MKEGDRTGEGETGSEKGKTKRDQQREKEAEMKDGEKEK